MNLHCKIVFMAAAAFTIAHQNLQLDITKATLIVDKCLWCDILWSAECYTNCSSGTFVRQCETVLLKLHYNHCIKSRSSCSGRTRALVSKQPLRQVSPKPLTYHKLTSNTLDKRTVGAVASLSNSPYE